MNFPLPDIKGLPEALKRRSVQVVLAAGSIGVVLIWLAVSALRNGPEASVSGQDTLLLSALEEQRKVLERGQEVLGREQEAMGKELEEYGRLFGQLQKLEGRLEGLILGKRNSEEDKARQDEEARKRIAEIERLRKLSAAKKDTVEMTNIRKLTKIYSAMRSGPLANVIKELREDLVLQILLRMEERKVARLLAAVEPSRAADLSSKLNRLKKKGE